MAKRGRRRGKAPRPKDTAPLWDADVIEMLGLEALIRPDGAAPGAPLVRALLRKKIAKRPGVVVGDRVRFARVDEAEDAPGAVIVEVCARRNVLLRAGWRGHPQPIAANLDRVVVVVSPRDPPLRLGLVDRYIAACRQADIPSAICLNKADLDTDNAAREALSIYPDLGVPVVVTQVQGGHDPSDSVRPLRALIDDGRAVLVGHSGVGKSSLARALIPGLDRAIGAVNDTIGRGRHTTTSSALLDLPERGALVDTPGIRAFGLYGIAPEHLAHLYPEYVELSEGCRFPNCIHLHEPRCAVKDAVEEEELDPGRYDRYIELVHALREEQSL